MIDFQDYSDYISIVNKTNFIFDNWFYCFKVSDKSPDVIHIKRKINFLSFGQQTKEIIELLSEYNAPEDIINIFVKREEIEKNLFRKKEKCTELREDICNKIEEFNQKIVSVA